MVVSMGWLIKDRLYTTGGVGSVWLAAAVNKRNHDHHNLRKQCVTYYTYRHTHNTVQYLRVTEEGYSQFIETVVTMGYPREQTGTRCAEGLFPFCNQTPRHHALVSRIV